MHHGIYPDTITFDKETVFARLRELGYDTADYESECDTLNGKEGRYNGWMDMVHDAFAYDFVDDKGEAHLVPAIVLVSKR